MHGKVRLSCSRLWARAKWMQIWNSRKFLATIFKHFKHLLNNLVHLWPVCVPVNETCSGKKEVRVSCVCQTGRAMRLFVLNAPHQTSVFMNCWNIQERTIECFFGIHFGNVSTRTLLPQKFMLNKHRLEHFGRILCLRTTWNIHWKEANFFFTDSALNFSGDFFRRGDLYLPASTPFSFFAAYFLMSFSWKYWRGGKNETWLRLWQQSGWTVWRDTKFFWSCRHIFSDVWRAVRFKAACHGETPPSSLLI